MELAVFLLYSGKTQKQLAEEIGVSRPTMNLIVKGKIRASRKTAEKLSAFTHGIVSVEEIMNPIKRN